MLVQQSDRVDLGHAHHGALLPDALLPMTDRWVVAASGVGSVRHELGRLAGLLGRPDEAREPLTAAAESHLRAECPAGG